MIAAVMESPEFVRRCAGDDQQRRAVHDRMLASREQNSVRLVSRLRATRRR